MKKFKDFVKSKKPKISRIPHPHEMYVAVIHHGSHSQVRDKSSNRRSSSKKKKISEQDEYDNDPSDIYDEITDKAHGIKGVNTEDLMNKLFNHPSIDTNNNPFSDQLSNYTTDSRINQMLYEHHLRGFYGDDGYHPDMVREASKRGGVNLPRLDHAIHHGSAPYDLTVFSGLKWKPPKIIGGKPNKIFLPSFTSGSLNAATTENFSDSFDSEDEEGVMERHIAMINIPKGTPMAVPGKISPHYDEHEVTLARGAVFKTRKPIVMKNTNYDPYSNDYTKEKLIFHPFHIEDILVHPSNFEPFT